MRDLRFRRSFRLGLLCLDIGLSCLLLLGCIGWCGLSLGAIRRSPEGKVVSEQLHDEGTVAVRLLGERVQLSNGIIESLLGEMAGTVWGVQDLVVEDGEVEGQAKADGVGWSQLGLCNVGGILDRALEYGSNIVIQVGTNLVSLVSSSCSNLALLARGKLSQVAVVVTLPVVEPKSAYAQPIVKTAQTARYR